MHRECGNVAKIRSKLETQKVDVPRLYDDTIDLRCAEEELKKKKRVSGVVSNFQLRMHDSPGCPG